MKIDLDQLMRAFSRTVDLVGVDDMQHGKRVAFMADVILYHHTSWENLKKFPLPNETKMHSNHREKLDGDWHYRD